MKTLLLGLLMLLNVGLAQANNTFTCVDTSVGTTNIMTCTLDKNTDNLITVKKNPQGHDLVHKNKHGHIIITGNIY